MPELFVVVMLPFAIGFFAVAFVVTMSVIEVVPTVGEDQPVLGSQRPHGEAR